MTIAVLARNCLTLTLDYIVMQMTKINHEKGYSGCKTQGITFRSQETLGKNLGKHVARERKLLSAEMLLYPNEYWSTRLRANWPTTCQLAYVGQFTQVMYEQCPKYFFVWLSIG